MQKLLTVMAIVNTVIIALFSYLTVFMSNNQIGATEKFAGAVILSCLLGSVVTKIIKQKFWIIILSLLFDFILITFLYNITDYNSIYEFIQSLFNIATHVVLFIYLYLIFYYVYKFKQILKKRTNYLV